MGKIYASSDLHFCHNRGFIYEPRGFKSVHEMNETIVKNWNSVVNPEDDVYLLGDIMLNDNETGIKLLKSLKGNIHIIRGNHCTDARVQLYSQCWNVVEIMGYADILKYNGYRFYLSHYPTIVSNYDDDKPLKAKVINVCGHQHTQDPFVDWNKGIIFHAEVDSNNCYPWNIEDIIQKIKEKKQ